MNASPALGRLATLALAIATIALPTVSAEDRVTALEEASKGIGASNARYVAAIERGDGYAILDLYEKDAVLIPSSQPPIRGNAVIAGVWNELFGKQLHISLRLVTDKIERSCDLATETGTFTMTGRLKDKPEQTQTGDYFALWRLQENGGWKLEWHYWGPAHVK